MSLVWATSSSMAATTKTTLFSGVFSEIVVVYSVWLKLGGLSLMSTTLMIRLAVPVNGSDPLSAAIIVSIYTD